MLGACVKADALSDFKNDVKSSLPAAVKSELEASFKKVQDKSGEYGKQVTTTKDEREKALKEFKEEGEKAYVEKLKEAVKNLEEASKEHSSSLGSSKISLLTEDEIKDGQAKVEKFLADAQKEIEEHQKLYDSSNTEFKDKGVELVDKIKGFVEDLKKVRDETETTAKESKKEIDTNTKKAENELESKKNSLPSGTDAKDKEAIAKFVKSQVDELKKLNADFTKRVDEAFKKTDDSHKDNAKKFGHEDVQKQLNTANDNLFKNSKKKESIEEIVRQIKYFVSTAGNLTLLHREATVDALKKDENVKDLRNMVSKINDESILGSGASSSKSSDSTPTTPSTEKESTGISKAWFIVGGVLLVIVVIAIVYFAFASSGSK